MTEQILLLAFFCALSFVFGWKSREQRFEFGTARATAQLYDSKWHSPAVKAAELLHVDQDATGDLPPEPRKTWEPPKRMPFWLERQYHFERFRAPRLRRAA
jgi:hypothetical protein